MVFRPFGMWPGSVLFGIFSPTISQRCCAHRTTTTLFQPHKGRFIYAPSNTIMPETPAENVRVLFEAIDRCRRA